MKRIYSSVFGIDQGEIVLVNDFETEGPMWSGEGPRLREKRVKFTELFRDPPSVLAHVVMWDTDANHNQRGDILTRDITEEGFSLVFRTWGDSRVARLRIGWIALGEIGGEDDWDYM